MGTTTTKFDKGRYEMLIASLAGNENTLSQRIMIQSDTAVDFRDPQFLPGSNNWHPASYLATQVKALSTSVFDRLGEVDTELTTFVDALKEAKKVFEDTDDLANYSATKFAEKFPNFTGAKP